jgi:hypothetical protein
MLGGWCGGCRCLSLTAEHSSTGWLTLLVHFGLLLLPQAETLGNLFRNVMYPPSAGGGLLRLHSTYRHDLKIYSSGGWGAT